MLFKSDGIFQENVTSCIYVPKSKPLQTNKFSYLYKSRYTKTPVFTVDQMINSRYLVKGVDSGTMGDIYHCYDTIHKTDVSLKTIISDKRDSNRSLTSFFEEVQLRMRLDSHPNVVYLMMVENIDGYPYIISEWIEGDKTYGNTLEQWIAEYPFDLDWLLDVMLQLCNGLDHCFRQLSTPDKPFVLGDLKPNNVLITKDHVLKLMDFSSGVYTQTYASPEQMRNKPLDARSDIYTLGLIADEIWLSIDLDAQTTALGKETRNLINDCLTEDIDLRMSDYTTLRNRITGICQRYSCKLTICEATKRGFLDLLYRIQSEMNMGWSNQPIYSSIENACWIRNKKFMNLKG